jgi:3,4-dihydroxy 2-butanone 4-phosphate synthase/GTP cyclohydrolase II
MNDALSPLFQVIAKASAPAGRPFLTLSYAQSLDGSIASRHRTALALSASASLKMTHRLRAAHDAILVGIGTILADDPRLNVRLVTGGDPLPIILDSHLRLPLEARVLSGPRKPWIAALDTSDKEKASRLESLGVRILRTRALLDGRVDLKALLRQLRRERVRRLMIEGGQQVITSFLRARLADLVVVTVAPILVGGLSAIDDLDVPEGIRYPHVLNPSFVPLGRDLVVWGELEKATV